MRLKTINVKRTSSPIASKLLEMVTRFYEGIYTGSAEDQIQTILSEAARVFEADTATWFLITVDRRQLRLVDVYNDLGVPEKRPPAEPYSLNWKAKTENDVKGLTAWVAISGEPLYVPSIESLTLEHGKCHSGLWDKWLYPQGIDHPESGFLCMYAVPLFLPLAGGTPEERVVGVLKMERRRTKANIKRPTFNKTDLEAFNVIARIMGFAYFHSERQKSLTLADIGHALIRPLGDVAVSLDSLAIDLYESSFDSNHAAYQVESASTMLRSLSRMMALAKESYNEPLQSYDVDIFEDLNLQCNAISLTSGREVILDKKNTIGKVNLTKRNHAALLNIAINLLQNATQNSPIKSKVNVTIDRTQNELILIVENQGVEVLERTIKSAKVTPETPQSFRGLPRSYQLAAQNGWELDYSRKSNRNYFILKVFISS
jgi:hypothetical protein